MKIVIDIPDAIMDYLRNNGCLSVIYTDEVAKAIINGTPLPKGHGDLKDTEKLKNAFITWSMAVQGNFTDADITSIIYNSPTIIEADKENKE